MLSLIVFLSAAVAVSCTASSGIPAASSLGRKLLARSVPAPDDSTSAQLHRRLNNDQQNDYSFLNDFSIKFQGCHHVQQWNGNADEENDVRIMTKRLIRFRLCPADQCSNEKSVGCTSKYGDYIVDMNTFLTYYLEAMEEEKENLCEQVKEDCNNYCGGDGDENYDCSYTCYDGYEATFCMNQNDQNADFDVSEYAACKEYDFPDNNGRRRVEEAEVNYYVGAYCADQGGEVRLGLFTDDTCTTYVSNGAGVFYSATGYALPYSQDSLVSTRCFNCVSTDDDGNSETSEACSGVYALSGKCESHMSIDYPNESSCNYIEGVKIIREDGVIRTSSTRKSKSAAVAIGLFTTLSVLLGGYVYYLRTKLSRAQINLSAASQPFT